MNVRRDAASRKPGDIRKRVLQSGEVMQVGQGRGPVKTGFQIKGLNRSATGAEKDPVTPDLD